MSRVHPARRAVRRPLEFTDGKILARTLTHVAREETPEHLRWQQKRNGQFFRGRTAGYSDLGVSGEVCPYGKFGLGTLHRSQSGEYIKQARHQIGAGPELFHSVF